MTIPLRPWQQQDPLIVSLVREKFTIDDAADAAERAAILEYDANIPRGTSEVKASRALVRKNAQ